MSMVKIYTNSAHEIKAVGYTDDNTLTEYTIDREKVFGNVSDAFIMGYKYEPTTVDGVETIVVTPYKDLDVLAMFNKSNEQVAGDDMIIVNHSTVEQVRAFHQKALGKIGSAMIYAGIDVNGEHFDLTDQDQTNLQQWFAAVNSGSEYIPYHSKGGQCRMFSADEIRAIATMATACVMYHTTRMNSLFQMLKEKTNKRDILAIQYDTPLDEARQTAFDQMMAATSITGEVRTYFDASLANAGKTVGEIYSNVGSMISNATYDTEELAVLNQASAVLDASTNQVTVTIPASFVDTTKLASDTPVHTISAIYHVLTNVDNVVAETYDTRYALNYNLVDSAANLTTVVDNGQVLSVLVPLAAVEHYENDTVSAEQTFYIIANGESPIVTTDYSAVVTALSITTEEIADEGTSATE